MLLYFIHSCYVIYIYNCPCITFVVQLEQLDLYSREKCIPCLIRILASSSSISLCWDVCLATIIRHDYVSRKIITCFIKALPQKPPYHSEKSIEYLTTLMQRVGHSWAGIQICLPGLVRFLYKKLCI